MPKEIDWIDAWNLGWCLVAAILLGAVFRAVGGLDIFAL